VQLRKDGGKRWVRALVDAEISQPTSTVQSTIKLQLRSRASGTTAWSAWADTKTKSFYPLRGSGTYYTDESYDPPNSSSNVDYQIRAVMVSNQGTQAGQAVPSS
jgi:hypothetical protein